MQNISSNVQKACCYIQLITWQLELVLTNTIVCDSTMVHLPFDHPCPSPEFLKCVGERTWYIPPFRIIFPQPIGSAC